MCRNARIPRPPSLRDPRLREAARRAHSPSPPGHLDHTPAAAAPARPALSRPRPQGQPRPAQWRSTPVAAAGEGQSARKRWRLRPAGSAEGHSVLEPAEHAVRRGAADHPKAHGGADGPSFGVREAVLGISARKDIATYCQVKSKGAGRRADRGDATQSPSRVGIRNLRGAANSDGSGVCWPPGNRVGRDGVGGMRRFGSRSQHGCIVT
jgi:hypothetical protein